MLYNSTGMLEQLDASLAQTTALRKVLAAHLTPTQWAIVENHMTAAELEYRTGVNSYATWRAIRTGKPAPITLALPPP